MKRTIETDNPVIGSFEILQGKVCNVKKRGTSFRTQSLHINTKPPEPLSADIDVFLGESTAAILLDRLAKDDEPLRCPVGKRLLWVPSL